MMISINTQILEWKDKIILADKRTGKWVRMSRRAYEIIQSILEDKKQIDLFEDAFD